MLYVSVVSFLEFKTIKMSTSPRSWWIQNLPALSGQEDFGLVLLLQSRSPHLGYVPFSHFGGGTESF
jgi:hypothetical protein